MQGLNLPQLKGAKNKIDYKNKMNVLLSHSSEYKSKKQ